MLDGVLTFAVAFAASVWFDGPNPADCPSLGIRGRPQCAQDSSRGPFRSLGGVAIYCGTVIAILTFVESRSRGQILGILAASTLLLVVGILE